MRFRVAVIEGGIWILGVMLLGEYCGVRAYADVQRGQGIAAFVQARLSARAGMCGSALRAIDQSDGSRGHMLAYTRGVARDPQPIAEARARIPHLGPVVPVHGDTSVRHLDRGVGLIAGTTGSAGPGNVAIAAHRDGLFRDLKDVEIGDQSEFKGVTPNDTRDLRRTPRSSSTRGHPYRRW